MYAINHNNNDNDKGDDDDDDDRVITWENHPTPVPKCRENLNLCS